MLALIDGDILSYMIPATAETHHCVVSKWTTGGTRVLLWEGNGKREANKWVKAHLGNSKDITVTCDTTLLPFSHCQQVMGSFITKVLKGAEADSGEIYLSSSDKSNFRLSLYPAYKANRKQEKPHYYSQFRDYLVSEYGAVMVHGMEADDALGIAQTQGKGETVICSTDKDLDTIPGLHYNWTKEVLYTLTEDEAHYHLYHQMLTGDRVDNIIGLNGVGPKTADKILHGLDAGERVRVVTELYKYHLGRGWEEFYDLNLKLLTILREPLPKTPDVGV